jgi:excisionase family DNA binding protein
MSIVTFDTLPGAISELLDKVNSLQEQLTNVFTIRYPDSRNPLSIKEAAELLNLSKNTIYKLVQHKNIPFSKKGKRLYFQKDELISWINEGKILTAKELKSESESVFIKTNKNRVQL